MRIDITSFNQYNVIDTCSIWNILSSITLEQKAYESGCNFCCTQFVRYECLFKKRQKEMEYDIELKNRLRRRINDGKFPEYPISIEDLQDSNLLSNRKKLSKGEISSMVFAKKTRQAFLTDDQGARHLAEGFIGLENTQTIPHLFGWLTYNGNVLDSEKEMIIKQHKEMNGTLEKYLAEVYFLALEKRIM